MQRSERAMRLVIISHLFEHLRKAYQLEWPRKAFRNGQISDGELDALLAFKTDPRLDSLRAALVRLRNRTFGICLNCKKEIVQRLLDMDPSRRLCTGCERRLNHYPLGIFLKKRLIWIKRKTKRGSQEN
jgi:RNA polymerase-binding transcription factor DksA